MAIKRYLQGIAIVVLMMIGAMLIVMAAAPTITFIPPTPGDGGTVIVNYVNISITLNESGTALLKWNSEVNVSMNGTGTNFYYNKTSLINGAYSYIIFANDTNSTNWTSSPTRTVTVNVPASIPVLSNRLPSTPVSSQFNSTQIFNVTVDQLANVSWKIFTIEVQNLSVLAMAKSEYTNNTAPVGTYIVTATAINSNGSSTPVTWIWTVSPPPGPPSVSDISFTKGATWINWTWTNPNTGNFNHTLVKINSTSQPNTSNNFFNATPLNPGTSYIISLQTVDTSGNINSTIVSNSISTLNTQIGTNILVDLLNGVKVNFSNVTAEGATSKTTFPVTNNGTLFNIAGIAYNISTTAVFDSAIIEMSHSSANFEKVKLYHFENPAWKDVTTGSPDASKVRGLVTSGNFSPFVPGDVAKPKISGTPSPNLTTTGNDPANFTISFDQVVNVTWSTNSSVLHAPNISVTSASLFTSSPGVGIWNITASWTNGNGSGSFSWIWNVRPTTFFTGNRIWDGSKPNDFAPDYTWTPQSFSGFYYDAKDDVGSENILIKSISRTISKNNIIYSTSPNEVFFTYNSWGKYQVIGFMADKYFAGYKNHTIIKPTNSFDEVSAIGQGQLHKVLMDDNTKRTISVGGTLALRDGYVLQASDIDLNARTMFLRLLKNGVEVDSTPLSKDETYVYKKRVGNVEALPLILIRFDNVFSGQELQVAFLKGIFQISEDVTEVKTGNKFGRMEVTTVSKDKIEMKNSNGDVGLNKGSIVDLMGDLKIIVADNDVLRFALSVDRPGNLEVRSTVFRESDTNRITEWTPYNFGMNIGKTSIGFYYNLDDGLGNEKISMTDRNGRIIPDNKLVYSTSPEKVSFTYKPFGQYQVIGFMADKYFAGYTGHKIPNPTNSFGDISALSQGELHKIIIDDDTKRTISVGGTIALKEGYVLKATDIDLNARTMLLSLLKDGVEVDSSPLAKDETYVYKKSIGSVSDLPIIMVRFDNVFSGQELQVAFLKGIFQLSETATTVKIGNQYGKMEVRTVNKDLITMSNDGSIGLDKNKNDVLMGNIKLKVADSDTLRFYFAVDVTPEMIVNQLAIDAPPKAMAGDTIRIKITAGAVGMDNATISIGTESGTTDKDGILNYTLPRSLKGTYSITATKTGYEKATQNIEIEKYVDYRLSIEAPSQSNQFETIMIKVLYNGTAMSGAAVTFDNMSVGTSDSNGEVTYKLETSGTHSITASKKSYISVTRDIEIRAPYSEFKALDINITPNPGFAGEEFVVRSNITNIGTKSDSLLVELIVNGTGVDNKTVTLGAKEKVEVNFTRIEEIAGNVTIEIMGQSVLYEAKENPTNYLLIGAIVTGIGAVIIYTLTSKGLLSVEILKQKSILLKEAVNLQTQKLSMLFKK